LKIWKRLDLWDLAVVAGGGLILFGLWELYPPARWILLGGILVVIGIRKG
jgi:hypothetical protein